MKHGNVFLAVTQARTEWQKWPVLFFSLSQVWNNRKTSQENVKMNGKIWHRWMMDLSGGLILTWVVESTDPGCSACRITCTPSSSYCYRGDQFHSPPSQSWPAKTALVFFLFPAHNSILQVSVSLVTMTTSLLSWEASCIGMSCGRPFFDLCLLVPNISEDTSMGMLRSLSLMLSCKHKSHSEVNYYRKKPWKLTQIKTFNHFCVYDVLNFQTWLVVSFSRIFPHWLDHILLFWCKNPFLPSVCPISWCMFLVSGCGGLMCRWTGSLCQSATCWGTWVWREAPASGDLHPTPRRSRQLQDRGMC